MFKLILYRLHHLLYDDLRWASSKNKYTSMLPNPILQLFMFLGKKILMKKRIHFFPLTKNCWQPRFSWDDTYSIRGIVVGVIKVNSEIVVITAFVTTRRVGGKKINGKSYRRHGLMHAIFGLSNFNWLLTKKGLFLSCCWVTSVDKMVLFGDSTFALRFKGCNLLQCEMVTLFLEQLKLRPTTNTSQWFGQNVTKRLIFFVKITF